MFEFRKMKNFFEEHGIKQKYIARKTGITERTLSLIMNGKRKCTLEEYVKLCRLAGCDFTYFMNDTDEKAAKGA